MVDEWFVDTHKTVREEQFLKLDAQRDEIIFPLHFPCRNKHLQLITKVCRLGDLNALLFIKYKILV